MALLISKLINGVEYTGYFNDSGILDGVYARTNDRLSSPNFWHGIYVFQNGIQVFETSIVQCNLDKYLTYTRPTVSAINQEEHFSWYSNEEFPSKHLEPNLESIYVSCKKDGCYYCKEIKFLPDKTVTDCYKCIMHQRLKDDGTAGALAVPSTIPSSLEEIFAEMFKNQCIDKDLKHLIKRWFKTDCSLELPFF